MWPDETIGHWEHARLERSTSIARTGTDTSARRVQATVRIVGFVCLASVAVISCASRGWPGWTHDLVSALSCGMRKSEVVELAGQELRAVTNTAFRGVYGTHTLDRGDVSVWLDFKDGELVSFSRWRPQPWKLKSVYISPKENLCTGQLSFFLRIYRPHGLSDDAIVFLDGEVINDYSWARPVEVPIGKHELRIQGEGYEPVVKYLEFGAEDQGELWIDITSEELRPRVSGS